MYVRTSYMLMCLCFSPYQAEEASKAQLEQQSLASAGKELNCTSRNLLLISTTINHDSKSE